MHSKRCPCRFDAGVARQADIGVVQQQFGVVSERRHLRFDVGNARSLAAGAGFLGPAGEFAQMAVETVSIDLLDQSIEKLASLQERPFRVRGPPTSHC